VAVRWRNATRRRNKSVKMAAPLATCTKEGQRSVIRFLRSEEVKPIEIHRRMEVQYGDACLPLQQVYEWSRKFLNGVSSVTDSPRPGQAHRVVKPETVRAVEAIGKENRRVTVHEIAANLDMSHGSAHHIVHDVLQFHKVSATVMECQHTSCQQLRSGLISDAEILHNSPQQLMNQMAHYLWRLCRDSRTP
jgi:hypothetical protein